MVAIVVLIYQSTTTTTTYLPDLQPRTKAGSLNGSASSGSSGNDLPGCGQDRYEDGYMTNG